MVQKLAQSENIIQRLHVELNNLSRQQRKVAEFILDNFEDAAFMSLPEVSTKLGVGEATVIRLTRTIGLSGYQELRSYLQEMLKDTITPAVKISQTSESLRERSVLDECISMDLATLGQAKSLIPTELFETAVGAICAAKRVFVVGLGVSASIGAFIDHRLRRCGVDSRLLDEGGRTMAERIAIIDKADVLVAIGFYRCQAEVLAAAEYATEQGAFTIAITDSQVSSLGKRCHTVLPAKRGPVKVLTSPVVPMAVANALTIAIAMKMKQRSKEILSIIEQIHVTR